MNENFLTNIMNKDSGKFDEPQKIVEILTSDNMPYDKLIEFANFLLPEIKPLHYTLNGIKYQTISQVILECYKRIHGFSSNYWASEAKLTYKLKPGQEFITFSRTSGRGEICHYKMANFDQIDFGKDIPHIEPQKNKENTPKTVSEIPKQENTETNEDNLTLKKIVKLIHNGENIFITGHAGTGKSYILNKLKELFGKKLTITSTTGIAAVNVKGQTLHSWAGVGLCRNTIENTVEKIKNRPTQFRQICNCKILAVDEISMLSVETFEYVNEVLKQIRENDLPFGGIQVIFIGDFFQLPPVEREYEEERRYCFDAKLWYEFNLKNIVLRKNYRQNEENFINALSHMRTNRLTKEDIALLKTRNVVSDTSQTNILHIFSTNEEANRYNYAKFNAINKPITTFSATEGVYRNGNLICDNFDTRENNILEIFNKGCRADKEIHLKEGCKVMLLINMDFEKGLINGACGTVDAFNDNSINVTFDNGVNANIPKHKFEFFYNDKVLAERMQYPLKLAYGITIHKSQGMTLDKLVVDCARVFERGQVYVAMSRVKTLDGLYLKSFDAQKVLVDNKVAKFYDNLVEVEDVEGCEDIQLNAIATKPKKPRNTRRVVDFQFSDEEVEQIILDCIREFNGFYGKSGYGKILIGSTAIKENRYGIIKNRTRKSLDDMISNMVDRGILRVRKISYGRPTIYLPE